MPAKRKRPNDLRQSSLPETSDFGESFHYATKERCFTDTAISSLNGILSKDSSESPESETAATLFHETELRISDDFDRLQEDELLSPSFTTIPNTFGINSVVDVVSGFENGCDHREPTNLDGYIPVTSAEFTIQSDSEIGAVGGSGVDISQCGFISSSKNVSGSRSDDSALPSSADNSDGSNAMGLDIVINKCSNSTLTDNLDLSDSGEVMVPCIGSGVDTSKSRRNFANFDFSLNLTSPDKNPSLGFASSRDRTPLGEGITLNLPDCEDDGNQTPPDLPPRTYKAPPLPPRQRANEAPPLPPRNPDKHSMQASTHSVTTPTSPARSVESLDFVNLVAPLEPPPLPPRTYSPVNMAGADRGGGDSGSGGSMSLLSTEDSDSRSFDSMEAFSGSRESLQNDSSERERRSSGLGQDVIKREHKKLHRLSQGKNLSSLSGGLIASHASSLGAESIENQRPVTPPTREWRRSSEIMTLDRDEINKTPPPIVHRHKPVDSLMDSSLSEGSRSENFDSPVERLRSLNFAPVSEESSTPAALERLRSREQDDTPPPVERHKPPETSHFAEDRQRLIDSQNAHRPLNLSHSVGRHRHVDPQSSIMDRSRTFDRQRSVDSIPVDRLRNLDPLSNTHFDFEMPPSLPPFLNRQSSEQPHTDTVVNTDSSGQLVNSEGQNIYSPVLELQPPVYSRQRSREPPRVVDRQLSNESVGGSVFHSDIQSTKLPVRRSLSPAVRRVVDSSDRSEPQGAVGGSPALPVRTYAGIDSSGRPETPPRPSALGSGRESTPSPPVIHPRNRVLSDEERQQNRQNIHQHLQIWTQKKKEHANSSFGSDAGDIDLASPTSETHSLTNGIGGWERFDEPDVAMDTSQTDGSVHGAEGGVPLGQSAVSGRLSPTPSSSSVWQLRNSAENDPQPSTDSGK